MLYVYSLIKGEEMKKLVVAALMGIFVVYLVGCGNNASPKLTIKVLELK